MTLLLRLSPLEFGLGAGSNLIIAEFALLQ